VGTGTLPSALLDPLLSAPGQAGLFTDFDGTLSEIVADPEAARPVDGAVEVLADLATVFGRVGVLSGRPVSFLERFFPPSVLMAGLYGLEVSLAGVRSDHPLGGVWREVVDDVASVSVARGPAGMRVEPKGLSLTLHYREHPEAEADVRAWARLQAQRSGLEVREARMSFELHPPIPADKGTAIVELSAELTAVCFVGDDVGDLSAFDALDGLATQGIRTLKVAVHSSEESHELVRRADLVVDGPLGVLALMDQLRARCLP
jgi:trehalose 6-phosphate phosphatase